MIDIAKLQTAVGAEPDGKAGPKTWTLLFRKCGASPERAQEMAVCAARWAEEYGLLGNPLRLAHFMAQVLHESGNFRYMEEIASGAAYEGRADLGNTQPGDGIRYKGRGPIQITGRTNYRRYGGKVGIDLERHPELAAFPSIGFHLALEYWKAIGANALADNDNVLAITKLINGGTNGFSDRQAKLAMVKEWLV